MTKSLYTKKEEQIAYHLLTLPQSSKVDRLLSKIQNRHYKREVRIMQNKPNFNDLKNGFTQNQFPWLKINGLKSITGIDSAKLDEKL